MYIESTPWCDRFDLAIDDQLINVKKPPCAENGCGGCPQQYQRNLIAMKPVEQADILRCVDTEKK